MELHQANEDMQDFVHMVTHDLKGPLRIAQSLFSFLVQMEQSHFSQKSVDLQGRIQRALQRSQKLIDGLLQLSTIRDGMALEPVDLTEVVNEVKSDLETSLLEKQATVHLDTLPLVQGNRTLLVQVFTNLLQNALKYNQGTPVIRISAERQADNAVIGVHDNGIGIAPEHHERIFRSLERLPEARSVEGSGMGLAICKKIVEALGGKIAVTSEQGEGSIFWVTLPLA